MTNTLNIAVRSGVSLGASGQRQNKPPVAQTPRIGMTIDETAAYSGIGRNTLRQLVSWGMIPTLKIGRKSIIRVDVIDRFMEINQGFNLLDQNQVRPVK